MFQYVVAESGQGHRQTGPRLLREGGVYATERRGGQQRDTRGQRELVQRAELVETLHATVRETSVVDYSVTLLPASLATHVLLYVWELELYISTKREYNLQIVCSR